MAQKALAVLLLMISSIVFVGIASEVNMWPLICCYWAVLTIKNALDALERKEP